MLTWWPHDWASWGAGSPSSHPQLASPRFSLLFLSLPSLCLSLLLVAGSLLSLDLFLPLVADIALVCLGDSKPPQNGSLFGAHRLMSLFVEGGVSSLVFLS